jgi:hypothetical protein
MYSFVIHGELKLLSALAKPVLPAVKSPFNTRLTGFGHPCAFNDVTPAIVIVNRDTNLVMSFFMVVFDLITKKQPEKAAAKPEPIYGGKQGMTGDST